MSNRSRPGRKRPARRRRSSPDGLVTLTSRGPSDLICMLPYLLGFDLTNDVVVVSLEGPRQRIGAMVRFDPVPPQEAAQLASFVAAHVEQHGFEAVIVVIYTDDVGRADALIETLVASVRDLGVAVVEAVRADGRRWWSYLCDGPCCPPEGVAYDPRVSRMAAEAVLAGLAKAASRDALADRFAPASDQLSAAVAQASEAMLESCLDGRTAAFTPEQTVAVVDDARARLGDDGLDVETLARLLVMAQQQASRDAAWMMMERATAEDHLEVWSQVTRVAPALWLPPVGSLAGFAAWLAGHGVLAALAADRVLEVAPDYSMGGLLRSTIEQGLDPRIWDSAPWRAPSVS